MRVLFTTYPERTHFLTMAPLAWALRTAGHEVLVASQPRFAETITDAGLTAVPVGRDCDHFFRVAQADPTLLNTVRAGLPPPWDVAEDPARATWRQLRLAHVVVVQAAHKPDNFPIIKGLVEFARQWRPDLVIWEPLTYAGAIAAKATGAAHARLLFGPDSFGVTREHYRRLCRLQPATNRADPLAEWLAGYGDRYGFEFSEDLITGQFSIDLLPPSLGMAAELHYVPVRYVPYGGTAVVPAWLWRRPRRRRVALTLGLSPTDHGMGYSAGVQTILDALGGLDIELVATIADSERHRLTVPDNARVVSYVPLHALVPTCAVVVHHAGFGTLATTALHAVPQLTVPQVFDGPVLARRLVGLGAGLSVDPCATVKDVRESLCRLLDEPAFGRGALALREEMLAMPSPNDAVAEIEQLVDAHRATAR